MVHHLHGSTSPHSPSSGTSSSSSSNDALAHHHLHHVSAQAHEPRGQALSPKLSVPGRKRRRLSGGSFVDSMTELPIDWTQELAVEESSSDPVVNVRVSDRQRRLTRPRTSNPATSANSQEMSSTLTGDCSTVPFHHRVSVRSPRRSLTARATPPGPYVARALQFHGQSTSGSSADLLPALNRLASEELGLNIPSMWEGLLNWPLMSNSAATNNPSQASATVPTNSNVPSASHSASSPSHSSHVSQTSGPTNRNAIFSPFHSNSSLSVNAQRSHMQPSSSNNTTQSHRYSSSSRGQSACMGCIGCPTSTTSRTRPHGQPTRLPPSAALGRPPSDRSSPSSPPARVSPTLAYSGSGIARRLTSAQIDMLGHVSPSTRARTNLVVSDTSHGSSASTTAATTNLGPSRRSPTGIAHNPYHGHGLNGFEGYRDEVEYLSAAALARRGSSPIAPQNLRRFRIPSRSGRLDFHPHQHHHLGSNSPPYRPLSAHLDVHGSLGVGNESLPAHQSSLMHARTAANQNYASHSSSSFSASSNSANVHLASQAAWQQIIANISGVLSGTARHPLARPSDEGGPWFHPNDSIDMMENYEALLNLAERLGEAKPKGCTKVDLSHMPVYRWTGKNLHFNDQTVCCICMGEFSLKQQIRCMPCYHEFHVKCIDKWLRTSRTCPVCRTDVTTSANSSPQSKSP